MFAKMGQGEAGREEKQSFRVWESGNGKGEKGLIWRDNSIAFGKSTSQRIYPKQRTHKIG